MEPACLFLEDGPMKESVAELGVPVSVVAAGRSRELWRAPLVVQALRRAIRELGSDLVFAHVPKAHAYAAIAARLERLPYLWWQHDPPQLRPLVKRVAALLPAGAVVCSSDFSAAFQRELRGRVPAVTIHCGTETDPLPEQRDHRDRGHIAVGAVGRLQRYKRYELFLRAAARVLPDEPTTRFQIIGGATLGVDGGYPTELRNLATELGLDAATDFTGHVDDAQHRVGELDVLVHTAESEPFGLVLIEAMLRGVPVIAPSKGGPAEIVRDGVDGFLVDVEDRESLAAAIVHLARDPDLRAQMGASGRARVLSDFSAERMATETWSLLRRVAEGSSPGLRGTED